MLYSKAYALEQTDKPVLLILHGLFGSSINWHSMASRFSQSHRVYALDLRNHGRSPWHDEHSYPAMAEDVAKFIDQKELGKVSVLGHSMGGKVAMQLALSYSDLLTQLIVADIAPVQYKDREHGDLIKAMQNLPLAQVTSRKAADNALKVTIAHPAVRAFLLQNLTFDEPSQAWQWRLNLQILLQTLPTVMSFPEISGLCSVPSLFIYGNNSDYVTTEHQTLIYSLFSSSQLVCLDNAGHWLHAEQPTAFYNTCSQFLTA